MPFKIWSRPGADERMRGAASDRQRFLCRVVFNAAATRRGNGVGDRAMTEPFRVHGNSAGRCDAVAHAGTVYVVATDPAQASDVQTQTANAMAKVDRLLAEAGSDKSKLLQATVYLSDIADKTAMDAIWVEWIGPASNWPQRACVGVQLAPGDRVEIVITAAVA